MAERCTTMMVVPIGGNVTAPLLACGWAERFADGVEPFLVAVAAAVAEEAVPGELLLADDGPVPEPAAEVEPDPPHAVSSRTSDAIPVVAAHPLLRITTLPFTEMTRS